MPPMRTICRVLPCFLLVTSVSFGCPVRAVDFVTYTDKAAFLAALASSSTDTFDNLGTPGQFVAPPANRTTGPHQDSIGSEGSLYLTGTVGDVWVTAELANYDLTFTMSAGNPTAIGGYFHVLNASNAVTSGTVNVSINGGQFLQVSTTNSATNFPGWVSTNSTPITNLVVDAFNDDGPPFYATANTLVLGQMIPVPEPSTYAFGSPRL